MLCPVCCKHLLIYRLTRSPASSKQLLRATWDTVSQAWNHSSSPAFHLVSSAYKLHKQGDNIQPWHTPFPIWNQSVVPCLVLTITSWPVYRFLRTQVRWSGIPTSLRIFQFVVIHTVKGFGIVNKAKIDIFLKFTCFFDDSSDVGNLISGSSAFSKASKGYYKNKYMRK